VTIHGTQYLAVGTMTCRAGEQEAKEGRVLLFEVSHARQLRLSADFDVPGCVYGMATLPDSHFAVAVNHMVSLSLYFHLYPLIVYVVLTAYISAGFPCPLGFNSHSPC